MTRSSRRVLTGWCSCATGASSIRTRTPPGLKRCSRRARSDERDACVTGRSCPAPCRRRPGPPGSGPVGVAAAAPRVAAADPGPRAADRRGRGGCLQRVRCLQRGVPARPQFGSANHLPQLNGTNRKALAADIAAARKGIRDHPGNRPPVRADPGLGPDRRVPGTEPAWPLQRPDARPDPGPLPHGRRGRPPSPAR
jgi:hypothetical protein